MQQAINVPGGHQALFLARIGEITLKGLNRGKFERRLLDNLKRRLRPLGEFQITLSQSRIWIEQDNAARPIADLPARDLVLQAITSVFGIVSASPVWRFPGGLAELKNQAVLFMSEVLADGRPRSFKVESRRGNKQFPLTSPEISNLVGETLIEACPMLHVDVHQPDLTLFVEVREQLYLYSEIVKGQKGLPADWECSCCPGGSTARWPVI